MHINHLPKSVPSPAMFPIFEPENPQVNRDSLYQGLMYALRYIPSKRDILKDRSYTKGDCSAVSSEDGIGIRSFVKSVKMLCVALGCFEKNSEQAGHVAPYMLAGNDIDLSDGTLGGNLAALCCLDATRTKQFCLALLDAITVKHKARCESWRPGSVVEKIRILDLGCGPFPLYSFFASMICPGMVDCVAVELNEQSFKTAQAIVRHLGLEGSIRIEKRDATKVDFNQILPNPEIVVTETFNIAGTRERGLEILKHCWSQCDDGCIIIPEFVTIHAALVESSKIETLNGSYTRESSFDNYLHFEDCQWQRKISSYQRGRYDERIEAQVPVPVKEGSYQLLGWAEYGLYGERKLLRPDSWISSPGLYAGSDGKILSINGSPLVPRSIQISYAPCKEWLRADYVPL